MYDNVFKDNLIYRDILICLPRMLTINTNENTQTMFKPENGDVHIVDG